MRTHPCVFGGPELLIVVGSGVFYLRAGAIGLLRSGHPLAALLSGVDVSRHNSTLNTPQPMGYFIGISAAGFWDYINLFVTTFFRNGLHWLGASLATGEMQHVDQIIAVPAWTGNFLVLVGCIWAYGRLAERNRRDLARFVLALILTTAFFAADVGNLSTALPVTLSSRSAPALAICGADAFTSLIVVKSGIELIERF